MFLQQTRSFVGFDDDSTNLQTTALTLNAFVVALIMLRFFIIISSCKREKRTSFQEQHGMEWLWCEMWWGCLQVNLFFHHILCFAFIVCSLDSSSTLCTTNQRNVISNNSADDRVYIDNHDDEDELNTCQVLHLRLFSTPLQSCVLHTSVISHPLQHPSTSSSHFLIVHDLRSIYMTTTDRSAMKTHSICWGMTPAMMSI